MTSRRVSLMKLLTAIFWGNAACVSDLKIQNIRVQFLRNKDGLLALLRTWPHSPPRLYAKSHQWSPDSAHDTLEAFALEVVINTVSTELIKTGPIFRSVQGREAYTTDELTGFRPDSILKTIEQDAPVSWALLKSVSTTKRQKDKNTYKDSTQVSRKFCRDKGILI